VAGDGETRGQTKVSGYKSRRPGQSSNSPIRLTDHGYRSIPAAIAGSDALPEGLVRPTVTVCARGEVRNGAAGIDRLEAEPFTSARRRFLRRLDREVVSVPPGWIDEALSSQQYRITGFLLSEPLSTGWGEAVSSRSRRRTLDRALRFLSVRTRLLAALNRVLGRA